jgi:hypothetical protein
MPTIKNRITFQASDELKEALEAYAQYKEQTVSAVIVGCLREMLQSEGFINPPKKPVLPTRDRKA